MQVEAQGGWQPAGAFTTWAPHWVGADRQLRQSYTQAGRNVLLELNYYVTQRQDAELINSQNFMIRQKDPLWSNVGEGIASVQIDGQPRQVRQAKLRGSGGQRLLVWQWNLINQQTMVNDQTAKLVLALDRVRMKRDDGLSVLIATPYEETEIEAQGGWQPAEAFTTWVPHWVGADRQLRQPYTQASRQVMLELNYYVTQRQGAELINSQNFMIPQIDPLWANVGERIATVEIDGQPRQVRQARLRGSAGQRLLVWQWNLINQQTMVNDHKAKLLLALDRMRLARDDGLSVLIATPYEETELEAAAATLARFAADMDPAIGRMFDQVEGK
jgi:EpsI family protein